MKVRCNINGLDCPHCASELQDLILGIECVGFAEINFAMGSLILDVPDDADEEEVVSLAQKVADNFADGITITLRD